jgi:ABC transporter with metal-binding/Fe-S-binding domain ATP-binding protein
LKVGVLFSGGKDSTFAAYLAKQRDRLECLVTISPLRNDSYMFHYPNILWTKLQAEAMNLPQVFVYTEGLQEKELLDLKTAIAIARDTYRIEGLYIGALASLYQKSRVERICSALKVKCISPLWMIDPELHLKNLIKQKFSVIVTGVAAWGFDESWLGRVIDDNTIKELKALNKKYKIHIAFEGGEGETFTLDCPIFERKIELLSTEKHWHRDSGYLQIKEAKLIQK